MTTEENDGRQAQQHPPVQAGSPEQLPELSEQHAQPQEAAPAVRFASKVEEIAPENIQSSAEPSLDDSAKETSEATPEQLKALSSSLHGVKLQEQRMKGYSFEPFSLPPSRVPQWAISPPGMGSRPDIVSPPLTPAGTSGPESSSGRGPKQGPSSQDGVIESHQAITPQASSQESAPNSPRLGAPRIHLPHRPRSEDHVSRQAAPGAERNPTSHRKGMFSVGPDGGGSLPGSRDSSPNRLSAASQYYTRPFTPAGDANDPYAASKRAPQTRSAANIEQRFVFNRHKGRSSPGSSTTSLNKMDKGEKRHSGFLGVLNKSNHDLVKTGTESTTHSRHSSMTDLRRFFKVGQKNQVKKSSSPGASKLSNAASSRSSVYQVPFADDHGLTSKYGKIGRVLGSGAGGSVKLMRRNEDNTVFAVKEFRPRHTYETEKDYVKKLTAEFCVGSALHHGNIIETLDIVQEKGKWYEVMEYAPYDLFAIVMTGKMSKAEVSCCFLQIFSGVTYLHSMGLAHRDLKLDNVVVSENGIMKIIDFGSAHVFKYPFESGIVSASGVVGSDPYLAPEVYDERKYDPQAVDIWSLAIIYCCMSLRRFPWKVPRMTDNSYKLFAAEPSPGHDPKKLVLPPSRSMGDLDSTPHRDIFVEKNDKQNKPSSTEKTAENPSDKTAEKAAEKTSDKIEGTSSTTITAQGKAATPAGQPAKEIIRGPWRLLRLLPRESRHIIGRMLTIKPRDRATMAEILEEPWVSDTVICRQTGPGQIISADDHTHILEPPAQQSK
ncbi:HAL protein kinase [Apiospora kogelbergensis]|uniref:non-specific serine/threonine protein kinase n=1 Tax=Apiospora kogelbergensis TaxID=1337665 RepID=A0AAW0QTH2_9PEZI